MNLSPSEKMGLKGPSLGLLCSLSLTQAQTLEVLERGPNHELIDEHRPDGSTSRYVSLCSGMNHLHPAQPGVWQRSSEAIEIFDGAAVARQGQARIIFAPNLNAAGGAFDILSPGGQRFVSPPADGQRE